MGFLGEQERSLGWRGLGARTLASWLQGAATGPLFDGGGES